MIRSTNVSGDWLRSVIEMLDHDPVDTVGTQRLELVAQHAIRGGAPAGLKNSRGCGSKVITQTGRPRASAAARTWASKA
jgi:hypothetical protein